MKNVSASPLLSISWSESCVCFTWSCWRNFSPLAAACRKQTVRKICQPVTFPRSLAIASIPSYHTQTSFKNVICIILKEIELWSYMEEILENVNNNHKSLNFGWFSFLRRLALLTWLTIFLLGLSLLLELYLIKLDLPCLMAGCSVSASAILSSSSLSLVKHGSSLWHKFNV